MSSRATSASLPDVPNLGICRIQDRFFAHVIDNFIAVILALIAAAKTAPLGNVAAWGAAGAVYFGYYFLSETLFGNTFGKWCCGLCVRTVLGQRCRVWQMTVRSLLRILETNPILLGTLPAGIAVLTSRRRQRLGDRLAGTVVVPRM